MKSSARAPLVVVTLAMAALMACADTSAQTTSTVPITTVASTDPPVVTRPPVPDRAPLRDAAARVGLHIGTAVSAPALAGDADYAALLAGQFDAVTPENAMKMDVIQPRRGTFMFDAADGIVDAALANGQRVHGHPLIWYRQNPSWLQGVLDTRDHALAVMRDHIVSVMGHFAGRVEEWNVVNEAIADNGSLRDNVWLRAIGPDYIEQAFRMAREADPTAKLYYNDYGAEPPGGKADGVLRLATSLRDTGVQIDGVGFQMHLVVDRLPDFAAVAKNLGRFSAEGFAVAVTELDVAVSDSAGSAALDRQAEAYGVVVGACRSVPTCHDVTVWGFTDRQSWIPTAKPGYGRADIYDENLIEKPARRSLFEALRA